MNQATDHSHIPDWGVDLDPSRRPGVPMEQSSRMEGTNGTPAQQPQTVEVLHSIERPGMTPVFGTSVPPSGLSGWIRRRAFQRSESDMRHWMLLLLADRVNVAEGLLEDVRESPRARAVALGTAGALIAAWMLSRRRRA